MAAIRQKARTLLGLFALLVAGAAVSALTSPAPAAAHPCEQAECDDFLFWSWCEDDSGNETSCLISAGGGGCLTEACVDH